jgi:hypothetical protein
MAPHWQSVRKNMDGMLQAVTRALEAMRRIDGYVERCEQIRRGEPKAARALGGETLGQFIVASLVIIVAAGGAFVNFQLIALPMAELVPSTTRVAGTPVSSIAALVLVLTEMTAGLFVMEALGLTDMFPAVGRLSTRQRRIVLGVAFGGLFILACIESSLAILREQIVAADLELRQALAGAEAGAVSDSALSSIPLVGQAVLGFVLPFLLALIALPLETLIASGRYVGARGIESALFVFGVAARVLGRVVHYGGQMLAALLDVVIGVPLLIERLVSRRAATEGRDPASSRTGRADRDRSAHEIGLQRRDPGRASGATGERRRETPLRPRPGGAELPPRAVPASTTTPERAVS